MKLGAERREYGQLKLSTKGIKGNPMEQFEIWLNEAQQSNIRDATAMSVATIGADGYPQSRIVLLKDYGEKGFTFFTDYRSAKGQSINNNPRVELHFFWPEFERQIRISGIASKTPESTSRKYFNSRPVESQWAAIASTQSEKIASREELEKRYLAVGREVGEKASKPDFWGGYIVSPEKIEFWQGRENRLHDRILYVKDSEGWEISRLSP